MKKFRRVLWGILLLAAGVIFLLDAVDVIKVDLFFRGWWTLFIIVPCAVDLLTERDKTGSLIGLTVGVCLLLVRQNILDYSMFWKLLLSIVIIIFGVKLIFGSSSDRKTDEILSKMKENGTSKVGCAVFSGCNLNFDGQVFEGAELTAAFGGVKCDLRNAIFEKDSAIKVSAIFGGVDILVPDTVNVVVNSTNLFGGTSNKSKANGQSITLYVSGTCMFGGLEIK